MTWSPHAQIYDPIKVGSIDGTDTEPHDRGIVRALDATYTPNDEAKGKAECTVFVARLDKNTTTDTLADLFSSYGRVRRATVVRDIVTGASKGYAFVVFDKPSSARDAVDGANRKVVDGRTILVDRECERTMPGWKPRRLGGGFGGKKESGQLRFGGRDRPFRRPIVPVVNVAATRTEERRYERPDRERRDSSARRQERY